MNALSDTSQVFHRRRTERSPETVARHAPLGSRAADHPHPRDQDEIAAGCQAPRGGRDAAAPCGPGANGDTLTAAVNVSATPASSTRQQDLALQLDSLEQAGCARIFRDVGSGTIRKRPQLEVCLDYLRAGAAWSSGGWIVSAAASGISSTSSPSSSSDTSRSGRCANRSTRRPRTASCSCTSSPP
jgi:hypothetical protein